MEEIGKRSEYILACHDKACGDHDVYPFEGMELRKRRQFIPGFQFYFGDMPAGAAEKAAPAMKKEDVPAYLASLVKPSPENMN